MTEPRTARTTRSPGLPLALVAQALGAAAVLLIATREWQTVTTTRPRPFTDLVQGLSGRTVDAVPTALGLVALAGVVAVVATKGVVRRVIGALVALAGAGLVWRSLAGLAPVSPARARELVRAAHPQVVDSGALARHIVTHPAWPVLSAVAGLLVLGAGAAVALRGGRWTGLSARYERSGARAPVDPEQQRARADATLWTALERGEDPTAHDPKDVS